jgi:DNA-directed RNA polymerase subunit M/transcription elongation factor TFIIS
MKICPKCNNPHEKSGVFCSRSCANSRGPRTEEFKIKVREKITLPRNKTFCMECGTEFIQKKSHNGQKFCSKKCVSLKNNRLKSIYGLSDKTKNKMSETRKKMFAEGKINVTGGTTKWLEYKDFKVQGSYELRTCYILDNWKNLGLIKDWKYTNKRITYTNIYGKTATYLLDFKLITNNEKEIFVETKGFIRENDELKWEMCSKLGMTLKVWFLSDIEIAEKINTAESLNNFLIIGDI